MTRRKLFVICCLIFEISLIIPLLYIDEPMRNDEGTSILRASLFDYQFNHSLGQEDQYPYGTQFIEQSPPYYIMLKAWMTLLGEKLVGMRLLSAIFYGLTCVFFFLWIRNERDKDKDNDSSLSLFEIFGVLFILTSPTLLPFSIYIREYSVYVFLAVFSGYLFERMLDERNSSLFFPFLASTCLVATTFYTGYFFTFSLYLYLYLKHGDFLLKDQRKRKIFIFLFVFLALLCALKTPNLISLRFVLSPKENYNVYGILNDIVSPLSFLSFATWHQILVGLLMVLILIIPFFVGVVTGKRFVKLYSYVSLIYISGYVFLGDVMKYEQITFTYILPVLLLSYRTMISLLREIRKRKIVVLICSSVIASNIYFLCQSILCKDGNTNTFEHLTQQLDTFRSEGQIVFATDNLKDAPGLFKVHYETLTSFLDQDLPLNDLYSLRDKNVPIIFIQLKPDDDSLAVFMKDNMIKYNADLIAEYYFPYSVRLYFLVPPF